MLSLALWTAAGVAVPAAACSAIATAIGHRFTTPRRVAAVRTSAGLPARDVRIPSRGEVPLDLAATLTPAPRAAGAVVLVHGRDAARGAELRGPTTHLVDALVTAGLHVLQLDLRGHGDSAHARMTYGLRERADVLGAVDYLVSLGVERRSIGVLGASMGAVAALEAAACDPAIGALVSDSAFADFDVLLERHFTRLTRMPRWLYPAAQVAARAFTGERLRQHCPLRTARAMQDRPVLVIHARHDPFVDVAHGVALADAARAELWITEARGHLGSYQLDVPRYVARVTDFFCTHLVRNATPSARRPDLNPTSSAASPPLA
ncbi:MAG: alpha/beta fold hydrolase [Gemmatimonadaceae bacterium]|nr:alpha/beta fold hydrolase [Gemmatimonadaceae bacterium]